MATTKTHVFRGKRYAIKYVPTSNLQDSESKKSKIRCLGKCSPPDCKNRIIKIDKNLKDLEALEVEIHEPTHAMLWDLDESVVFRFGKDLSSFLYRLGYRKCQSSQTGKSRGSTNAKVVKRKSATTKKCRKGLKRNAHYVKNTY